MMKHYSISILFLFTLSLISPTEAQVRFIYQDVASPPPEARTIDLLFRMTVEEKVGQLLCQLGWGMYSKEGKKVSCSNEYQRTNRSTVYRYVLGYF